MALSVGRAGLRRESTPAEHKLWKALRAGRLDDRKFRRQQRLGPFYADFVCQSLKLVIEIDGGQHSSERDTSRARMIEGEGYRVLRFWNNDVLQNMPGVCEYIHMILNGPTPANEK